ncbi:thiamine phosphate synthase [Cecembia lonarensis]|uniref:Thiamine-phosphate synthase n=1 Tax=Cecembia lonarensis (strain CCUG 58316 / KCTC 22772 / LW9) TaxID=1225176 RepID=K1L956_CECL9|nr:thiamine phosphate synthase [Cecembia lonarensis]EKB48692.1 Thiamine-phosphate synthase [Cecembia lonarensis LW9]
MNQTPFPYRLYLVTDEALCLGRDFFWVVEEAIKGGVDIVQLREKSLSADDFIRKAEKLKTICDQNHVPLIINDSVEVAKKVDAQGLHIGQEDTGILEARTLLGSHIPMGLSLERMEDLKKPHSEEAWYYGVSPIYATPTKMDTKTEWGLNGLAQLRRVTEKPLVAIGRVKTENAAAIISHGADCLAVVSGICSAPSPAHAAEAFRKKIEAGLNHQLW